MRLVAIRPCGPGSERPAGGRPQRSACADLASRAPAQLVADLGQQRLLGVGPGGGTSLMNTRGVHDEHHDDEDDQGIDEQSPADRDLLAVRVGAKDGLDRGEVDAVQGIADRRQDDRVDERRDDHAERGADDDADRQGQGIGLGQERLEPTHGGRSLSARRLSACSWPRRSSPRLRSPTAPGGPCPVAPHRLLEGRGEVRRVALRELGRRIDSGGLEQVGVFRADALDAHQVDAVDPLEDVHRAEPGRLLDGRPAARLGPHLEERLGGRDPGKRELLGLDRSDALDLFHLHARSSTHPAPKGRSGGPR